ncbi:MAG: DUF2075 domain-containing protein [Paludibacteraceae bacterium]|nr:DUF2075 domain-containing protein [Paludibacteraceae bacterium]
MPLNSYYSNTISAFVQEDPEQVRLRLVDNGGNEPEQKMAWIEEIDILQSALLPFAQEEGRIIFEYSIPRMGKRIDVVLLLRGIVFVLEFKCGAKEFLRGDAEQVIDYALDLKYFHEESANAHIVPILVATKAKESEMIIQTSAYSDHVYTPILSNSQSLAPTIIKIADEVKGSVINLSDWERSNYQPTPTIIEAARSLYAGNTVEDITRTEASGKTIRRTTEFVKRVVRETKESNGKTICFVTGVPGAGKTLVGLNIAFLLDDEYRSQDGENNAEAVYMSGNGPLVKVLREALTLDKIKREEEKTGKKPKKEDAEREASTKVQGISDYRERMLHKLDRDRVEQQRIIEINPAQSKWTERNGHAEPEHIAIFDEAQRCWNNPKIADWLHRGGSYGNKMKIDNFPMSEAEFLIWSLNLRPDWAVIICLVGGGQEIHDGEAGIGEWIRAINERFPEWRVCISDQLQGDAYEKGNTREEIAKIQNRDIYSELHLSVSMRSFRAERLANWVEHALHFQVEEARKEYKQLISKFPIKITRDLNTAKRWLKQQARGSERYGLIVSSKAARLRPLAIDVKRKINVVNWFLGDKELVSSSYFLEDTATEFDIQGLELDWTCVVWDGDLRYTPKGWNFFEFNGGNKWNNIKKADRQAYLINAYRVLLTRARQGMIICVPEGSPDDHTRLPEYYDATYNYLKSLGIEEI